MATLTNTKIKDTYDGLLKTTDNEALDVSGVTLIEDGLGNASALSVGRSGNGVSVSGNLAVDTNTLYVDAANNRVGVGTSSPAAGSLLDVNGDIKLAAGAKIKFNDDRYFSPENNVDGAEISANGIFKVKTGATPTERIRIDSSGNVGIGTQSPTAFANSTVLAINNSSQGGILELQSNGTSALRVACSASDSALWEPRAVPVLFGVNNTERMRIDSSGKITSTGASEGVVKVVGSSASHRGEFLVEGAGQFTGSLVAVPSSASTYNGISASTVGITTSSTPLVFATSNTERMRITSGGYLKASNNGTYYSSTANVHEMRTNVEDDLVTIFSNSNASSPYGVYIVFPDANPNNTTNYFLRCASTAGVTRLFIYSNGNVVNTNNSYGAISDAKLKENVVDASPKLDDLLQVKVRNFNYIGDDKKQLGVVAQELESVFPSMIDESPDFEEQEVIDEEGNVTKERVDLGTTTKSVKYSVFVPMLIKAMQEQQEIINDLKARIETLEAK